MIEQCMSCYAEDMFGFHSIRSVPVHSVLLLNSRDEALNSKTGDIVLAFCRVCGFVFNTAFSPSLHEYSSRYEETQGFSSTFNTFHKRLADHLIAKYDLHQKDIIEIGCGKGEFLDLLCELGDNRGVGIDPAYVPGRTNSNKAIFIKDFYSEKYAEYIADFVCCKMTLEHMQDVYTFVKVVRRSIGDYHNSVVFFQVPNVRRIFQEVAFWDIYYEHCSYFSLGSMGRLFRRSGFDVIDLWQDYGNQYLMIEARPGEGQANNLLPAEDDLKDLDRDLDFFVANYPRSLEHWVSMLQSLNQDGSKIVLWGGGSKSVAFFTTLRVGLETIQYVVDINPYKAGTFIAGTGQEIVPPEFLKYYEPDVVIIMNPIYHEEVAEALIQMDLSPRLIAVQ